MPPSLSELMLADVMNLDRAGLAVYWESIYRSAPSRQTHIELLRQAVGWQLQAQIHGGLDSACRKQLQRGSVALALARGTRLIRQWQGVSYQVTVRDHGFEYEGQEYRSLSAIARKITGTAWNGLVFFGVKK